MRDYQAHKSKYLLPYEVYHQTLWTIRDYDRMKAEAEAILEESPPPPDGQPKGTKTGDEVFSKAMRREEYVRKTRAIEAALEVVPEEYRLGVWRNVTEWKRYPLDADRTTYGRWKSRFIFEAANRLGIV